MDVGERIKFLRKRVGLTQDQLAIQSQLSKNAIWNYENGKRTPTLDVLQNISKALNTTISYLTGESDFEDVNEDNLDYSISFITKSMIDSMTSKYPQKTKSKIYQNISECITYLLSEEVMDHEIIEKQDLDRMFLMNKINESFNDLSTNITRSISKSLVYNDDSLMIEDFNNYKHEAITKTANYINDYMNTIIHNLEHIKSNLSFETDEDKYEVMFFYDEEDV